MKESNNPENDNYTLIVKTHAGLEAILAGEVEQFGGTQVEILNRAIKCQANKATMYTINYCCRTAQRVLKEIATFEAANEDELYTAVGKINWEELIDVKSSFAVNATINRSELRHSHYAALKTKDAIVDRIRNITGQRPDVNVETPDLRIQLHITGTHCTILADSSGDSLHKRGYRTQQGEAPINEVLAAGMILLSGWDGKVPLLDPMCGSGTLLMEAFMFAASMPSGYFRHDYGFMKWPDFDEKLWNEIIKSENKKIITPTCEIAGSDISIRALQLSGQIIEKAGFANYIKLKQVSFENSKPNFQMPGYIITNPPYGERIKKNDLNTFYKTIGDVLKSKYAGFTAWMITSDFDAMKSVGLKTSQKIVLFNGPLECRFIKYELYQGTRKLHKHQDNHSEDIENHSENEDIQI